MPTISFATANYAGRALDYDEREDYAEHVSATIESTTLDQLDTLLSEIKSHGFPGIDLWMCHCDWQAHADDDFAEKVRRRVADAGLTLNTYAGGASLSSPDELDRLFGFMARLGAPILSGIVWGLSDTAAAVQEVCEKHDLRWARENHEEKSAKEMLAGIGSGRHDRCGITLDTSWCLRQGINALEAVKAVREHLFVVHLKDKRAGEEATCVLGEGVVPVEKIARYLVDTDWDGILSLEHEPLCCNPVPRVTTSLDILREWLAG